MISIIKKFISKQQFEPSSVGIFFNPYFISRYAIYMELKKTASTFNSGRVLDLGCGVRPYEGLFSVDEYIGVDIEGGGHAEDNKYCDIYYDGKTVPFPDSSFDIVLSTQVIEHVEDYDLYLSEAFRVLKAGGVLILTCPFVFEEHEKPYDFWRFSSFGITNLLEKHSFNVQRVVKCEPFFESLAQLLSSFIYINLMRNNKYIDLLITFFFCCPIQLFGIVLSFIVRKKDDFYLNLLVVAKK